MQAADAASAEFHADVVDREPQAADMVDERGLQRQPGVIGADRHPNGLAGVAHLEPSVSSSDIVAIATKVIGSSAARPTNRPSTCGADSNGPAFSRFTLPP